MANTLADNYVAAQVENKSGATDRANTFLEAQLEQLRTQVQTAEAAVAQYRAAHGLFAASASSSITQEELSSLTTNLLRLVPIKLRRMPACRPRRRSLQAAKPATN